MASTALRLQGSLWTKSIKYCSSRAKGSGSLVRAVKGTLPWTGCCNLRCETSTIHMNSDQGAHGCSHCIWKHILLSGPLFYTQNSFLSPDVGSPTFFLRTNNPFLWFPCPCLLYIICIFLGGGVAERLPMWISLEIRFKKQDCEIWTWSVPQQAYREQHMYPWMMCGSFVTGVGGARIACPMKYWAFTTLEQVFAYLGSPEGRACAILEEVPYVSLGWLDFLVV